MNSVAPIRFSLRRVLRRGRALFKVGVAGAFADTGLLDFFTFMRSATTGPRVHVLGYHRVVDAIDPNGATNPSLCTSSEVFTAQMREVKRRFEVLTLAEALAAIAGRRPLGRDACTITFDDGYRDVYLRAHPILAALDLPAAVFVPVGYAGTGRFLPHDRLYAGLRKLTPGQLGQMPIAPHLRPALAQAARTIALGSPAEAVEELIAHESASALEELAEALSKCFGAVELDPGSEVLSPAEIRKLAMAGWEIGAHTIGHIVLTHEPPARVAHELAEPRRALAAWAERPCRYFAYCNGYHSPAVVRAVAAAGYEAALTTYDRPNFVGGDLMRVGRKVLWEGHGRGPSGEYSSALSAAHLEDLFGTLGLTAAVDGERAPGRGPRSVCSVART